MAGRKKKFKEVDQITIKLEKSTKMLLREKHGNKLNDWLNKVIDKELTNIN